MSVTKKLLLSYAVILVLVLVLSYESISGSKEASEGFNQYRDIARHSVLSSRIDMMMEETRSHVRNFLHTHAQSDVEKYRNSYKSTMELVKSAQIEITDINRNKMLKEIENEMQEYNKNFDIVIEYMKQRDSIVNTNLDVNGKAVENLLTSIMEELKNQPDKLIDTAHSIRSLLLARLYTQKFLLTNSRESADRVAKEFDDLSKELDNLSKHLDNKNHKDKLNQAIDLLTVYQKGVADIERVINARNNVVENKLIVGGTNISKQAENIAISIKNEQDKLGPKMKENFASLISLAIGVSIAIILVILFLSIFITKAITSQIRSSINQLTSNISLISKGLLTSAQLITDSAISVSDSASHQASIIEQITATVEQSSANTELNSQNSRIANDLSQEVNEYAKNGYNEVLILQKSMEGITRSSNQISNIIKTIDEIAFQTNLLSLNAAVEAARAGEHGLGFAVVAEEVRSLANRSAGAAKETTEIISKTIQNIDEGNKINDRVNSTFKDIVKKIEQNTQLISEISNSSKELSIGMQQISEVLADIDKATQSMAGTSEELASSAEELRDNAQEMDSAISNVSKLV